MSKIEQQQHILIVDDEAPMRELVEEVLQSMGFGCTSVSSASDALKAISADAFDVVLTDIKMPQTSGLDLCQSIHELRPDIPVIIMTAFGSMDTAIEAIRRGAYDFVTKPFELELLRLTIKRASNHRALTKQIEFLENLEKTDITHNSLIGASEVMTHLRSTINRVARSDASILITGESGTGKELIAKSIHQNSDRNQQPFIAVNCGAISETLLESELFGHVKGAFTNAAKDRQGLIKAAEGGTLFLDEIGEMPPSMQVKLLRALEENTIRPVGGNEEIPFNVRIVAATHQDLETSIEAGSFREDLFYRINVIQLYAPPLRSRGGDVLELALHFLKRFSIKNQKPIEGFTQTVAEKLVAYSWPGNVRELRNVMERAVTLTAVNQIIVEDLPQKIICHQSDQIVIGGESPDELAPLSAIEDQYIQHVLRVVGGNRTLAAKVLGLDRKTLYRKLKQVDVQPAS